MTGYTILDGDQFTIGFWAKGWSPWGTTGAELTATLFYGSDPTVQAIGSTVATSLVRANTSADYVYFETTIAATAGSIGQELGISFVNTGVTDSFATLDDISINVIPEPATIGLIGFVGAGLLFVRRRLMM